MAIPLYNPDKKFYGAASLGEKGQIVIPAEARSAMKLHKGEKLLVFGMGDDMVAFTKLSGLEKFASRLNEHLSQIKEIAKGAPEKKKARRK